MAARFEADGDTWEVGYEVHEDRPELNAIVFHCLSNPQRPYRVLPLPHDVRVDATDDDEGVAGERWRHLFERSQIMDFVHDAQADPHNTDMRTRP